MAGKWHAWAAGPRTAVTNLDVGLTCNGAGVRVMETPEA